MHSGNSIKIYDLIHHQSFSFFFPKVKSVLFGECSKFNVLRGKLRKKSDHLLLTQT